MSTTRFAEDNEVNQHLILKVKQLRVAIDSCIQLNKQIIGVENNKKAMREYALVNTKLQEAKHWAGEALGELGQQLPEEYQDKAKAV